MVTQIICTSPMRTGSTWLCEITSHLLDINPLWQGFYGGDADLQLLIREETPGLWKLHDFPASYICALMDFHNTSGRVISSNRGLHDAIVSYAFFLRRRYTQENMKTFDRPDQMRSVDSCRGMADAEYVRAFCRSPLLVEAVSRYLSHDPEYRHPRLFATKYEIMASDIATVAREIADWFDAASIDESKIATAVEQCRFEKRSGGRELGETDNTRFYRCGQVGDYLRWLKPHEIDQIDRIAKTLRGDHE